MNDVTQQIPGAPTPPAPPSTEAPPSAQTLSIEERISRAIAPEPVAPVAEAPQGEPEHEAPAEELDLAESAPEDGDPASYEEPGESAPEVAPQEEVEEIESLSQLAEYVGADASDIYNLNIPITDEDGAKREIPLGELKDLVQESRVATKRAAETLAIKEQLETEQRTFQAERERAAQEQAMLLQGAETTLLNQYNSINWDALREQDPTLWVSKREEFREAKDNLAKIRQEAGQRYEQAQQQANQNRETQMQELVVREHAALLNAFPTWQKEDVRKAEAANIRTYLLDKGFKEPEVDAATDHRIIVLAHKAMLYDQNRAKGKVAVKKLAKAGGKLLRPGAKPTKSQLKSEAGAPLKARLKKSGSWRDAGALISHRRSR